MKMLRLFFISIAIAVQSGTAAHASDTKVREGPSAFPATGLATTEGNAMTEKGTVRPLLQQRNPRYQLCKGDVFELTFPFTPEFNQTVTVQPDGYITLMGVTDVYIAGKTVPELREFLQTAYAKILHEPVINFVLKDFEKPYFIAGGEISHPGKFDLRGDTTVTEAVAIAGGFTENSKHSQLFLFRRVSNDWVEVKELDVKKMFGSQNLSEDLHLQPGDMLYVPKSTMSKIKRYIPYPSTGLYLNPLKP
jgi:polysaccharide export outer membrane protein